MDLRRLRCAGPCACGGALVVLMVPPLRFILASQAGLVIGWRVAAMPSNILARLSIEIMAGKAEPRREGKGDASGVAPKGFPLKGKLPLSRVAARLLSAM